MIKLFDIDEPAGISSSVRQGSTTNGVFSQWIDVNINSLLAQLSVIEQDEVDRLKKQVDEDLSRRDKW